MGALTGQTISSTYDGLLKTEDNDILSATPKEITDGLGNGSGMTLTDTGDVVIAGDLKVGGLEIDSTGAVKMPIGTDAERPTPIAGMLRFNSTSGSFEGYDGSAWGAIGGTGSSLVQDEFVGNGTNVNFTLSVNVIAEIFTNVYISGVYQEKNAYSISGSLLTFSEAPANGITIEVITIDNISVTTGVTSVDGKVGVVSTNYIPIVISNNTIAVKNYLYVLTADLTLTLPITPANGDSVKMSNLSGVATCILGRNGSLIMGVASDLTLDTPTASFELIYSGATKGWVIIGL